jgi:release factor glutamine methyltransferase
VAWTIRSVLTWAKGYLQTKGSDTPRLDAEVLLADVLGKRRIDLYLDMDKPLHEEELASYRFLLKRRSESEPIAYILGRKEFYSREFVVNRKVLIPRPETEILVEKAVELSPKDSEIFEIGVGSGAVIISILLERSDLTGYANDVDCAALAVAEENARKHGVAERIHLFPGDTCKPLTMSFHTIVANPPYVSLSQKSALKGDVRLFEPEHALFAGNDGLDIIREIISQVKACLFPGGRLIMEVGYDQKDAVEQMVRAAEDLTLLLWIRDLAGIDRAVVVERTHG